MSEKTMRTVGWVLTGIYALFMLVASVAPKLMGAAIADETMRALGWPDGYVLMIGVIELALVLLYLYNFRTLDLERIPYQRARRGADDGTSGWCHGDADPGRQPAVQPRPVQHLSRPVHVGRPVAARSRASRHLPLAALIRTAPGVRPASR